MLTGLFAAATLLATSQTASSDQEVVTSLSPYEMRDLWIAETGDRIVTGRILGNWVQLQFMRNNSVIGKIIGEDCTGEGRRVRCETMLLERERSTVTYGAASLIADAVRADRYVRVHQQRPFAEGDRSSVRMWRYVPLQGGVTRAHLRVVMKQWGQALQRYDDAYSRYGELPEITLYGPPIPHVRAANSVDAPPADSGCTCDEGRVIEDLAQPAVPQE